MKTIVQVSENRPIDEESTITFSKITDNDDLDPETIPSVISIRDIKEIGISRIPAGDVEKFLFAHPVVPRGIEIKINRMVERGFRVFGKNKDAVSYIRDIFENSGDDVFLRQLMKNTYGFGNGYATLVPNQAGDEILKLNIEHPVFFDISKDEDSGEFLIDKKTRRPVSYTQSTKTPEGKLEIVGDPIPVDEVIHLAFDLWGDEIKGIPIAQYVSNVIKYLLNMEEAAAERIFRDGFTQKKFKTNLKSPKDLKEFAKSVTKANAKDSIVLPADTDVENLQPGTSDFPAFHDVFIGLLAIRIGIPKPLLILDGTSTNKSTLVQQKQDMQSDFRADEKIVETTLFNQLIKPACVVKYGNEFTEFPRFEFNPTVGDIDDRMERTARRAAAILNLTNAASTLAQLDLGATQLITSEIKRILSEENDEPGIVRTEVEERIVEESISVSEEV